jgi:hypothetical protein
LLGEVADMRKLTLDDVRPKLQWPSLDDIRLNRRTLTLDDVRMNWAGTVVAAPLWAYEPTTEIMLVRTSRGIIPLVRRKDRFRRIRELWGTINAEVARIRAQRELEEDERKAEWEARKDRLIRDAANDDSPTREKSLTELHFLLRAERLGRRAEKDAPSLYWPTGRAHKWCVVCGEQFFGLGSVTTCTEKCHAARRKQTHVPSKQPRPHVEHQPRACERCGESFTPRRSDGRFCSGRCRVAHHRANAT